MLFELDNLNLKHTKHPQTGNIQILEETEERGSRTPLKNNKRREQNNYYPFGLEHTGYDDNHEIVGVDEDQKDVTIIRVSENLEDSFTYKFGGKEYQDEFDVNLYYIF